MTGERRDRRRIFRAVADLLAVAAVFRHLHALALLPVVIAIRPAEVRSVIDAEELLGWQFRILLRVEERRPQGVELIASVLDGVQRAVVPGERVELAQSGRVTPAAGLLRLTGLVFVKPPDAAVILEQRTWH